MDSSTALGMKSRVSLTQRKQTEGLFFWRLQGSPSPRLLQLLEVSHIPRCLTSHRCSLPATLTPASGVWLASFPLMETLVADSFGPTWAIQPLSPVCHPHLETAANPLLPREATQSQVWGIRKQTSFVHPIMVAKSGTKLNDQRQWTG